MVIPGVLSTQVIFVRLFLFLETGENFPTVSMCEYFIWVVIWLLPVSIMSVLNFFKIYIALIRRSSQRNSLVSKCIIYCDIS